MVNLKMVTTVAPSTTCKQIVRVLLDQGHNRYIVFVTKAKPILFPNSKRLVPQSWNTSKGISQKHQAKGELNFFDCSDSKRFYSEPDVVKYGKTLITKGSLQLYLRY
jgi:hypothetical protein